MKLTKATDYAIVGLAYLAGQPDGGIASVRKISEELGIPRDFLSRIFHRLPFVQAHHGNRGGYTLAMPAQEIKVRDVIVAVEGSVSLNLCTLDPSECKKTNDCTLAGAWQDLQGDIDGLLQETSIADLVGDIETREVVQ